MPKVSFSFRCNDTREGLHVRVVGSTDSLGAWDTQKGVALGTSALEFPQWRLDSSSGGASGSSCVHVEFPEDEVVEYKYVVCDNAGQAFRWEDRTNRSFDFTALAGRGVIASGTSKITIVESFNCGDDPDENRFRASGSAIRGMASFARITSGFINTDKDKPSENGEFSRTVRERCPSISHNFAIGCASPGARSLSTLSYSKLPAEAGDKPGGYASEATPSHPSAGPPAVASGDGECAPATNGMVREESSSNLFLAPDDADPAIEPLEFEDRYSLIGNGPLGEGSFGLVWRCKPKEGGDEERAAKIVRKARLKPHEMRYLLGPGGEVKTHLLMKHPHIVELFEYFDEAHTVTMVLECCRGGDLFDAVVKQSRVNSRGLSELAASVATTHVLRALAHLHGLRYVHRDIKCENILLAHAGTPVEENTFKLADFGFVQIDTGEGLTERLGSPDTVAPEVVAGHRYSCPADLWSAGVLLYMMIYARPPFYASSDSEVLKKVKAGNYSLSGPLWDSISAPPKNLIASLMTVDAKVRPSAEEALKYEWLQQAP